MDDRILKETKNVPYALTPNKAVWVASSRLPNPSLITACFCIIKHKDNLVFMNHNKRGLDLVGGHKENESAVACVNREVAEETGILKLQSLKLQSLKLFAYQQLTKTKEEP